MTPSKNRSAKSAKRLRRTIPPKNRRTEILLEDINGKLTVIAEGHQMLAENMVRLDEKVERLDGKVVGIEVSLSAKIEKVEVSLSKRIDEVDQSLSKRIDEVDQSLSKRIDEVDQSLSKKIDSVADEVRGLRVDVQPRLDDHEARITALEGKPAA